MNEEANKHQAGPPPASDAVLERVQLDSPGGLTLGQPRSVGALTLVPVFHDGPSADYVPYASIQSAGLLEVTEVTGGGQVNTLVAHNRAEQAVLLLEGEILEGMQQTRVLNISVLVPARSRLEIPVSCVEAGRWHNQGQAAARHEFHLSPRTRSHKSESVSRAARQVGAFVSDQGAVWASVDDELTAQGVHSPTREFAEIGRRKRDDISRELSELAPRPGQAGVVAVVGGRPLCFDLFDRASTLEAVWTGLVGSYALDAMTVASRAAAARDAVKAAAWLRTLGTAAPTVHPGVGQGSNVVLSANGVGATALVLNAAVVHLAAFASRSNGGFERPSRRSDRLNVTLY